MELSKDKIYFGHQSVGFNIIDGMNEIINKNPQIKLSISEATSFDGLESGGFIHSRVGKNRDPESKLNHFSKLIKDGLGNKADIAFFKFCYIDITKDSDVESIFNSYKKEISSLKKEYPQTRFIQFTTPLTTIREKTWKDWIKDKIGKEIDLGVDDNIQRCKLNELIIAEYSDEGTVFDLAKFESLRPDGTRETLQKDGHVYYSMYPGYTEDGGHLNESGQKAIAKKFLLFLINLR